MGKIFFDDLSEGRQLDFRPVVFTREEMIAFAEKFDPQSFHVDEKAAGRSTRETNLWLNKATVT